MWLHKKGGNKSAVLLMTIMARCVYTTMIQTDMTVGGIRKDLFCRDREALISISKGNDAVHNLYYLG